MFFFNLCKCIHCRFYLFFILCYYFLIYSCFNSRQPEILYYITLLNCSFFVLGLRILAFPCNQFAGEEPGDSDEICSFAAKKNVKFDIFEKIDVNGDSAAPLWKFLKVCNFLSLFHSIKRQDE